MSNAMRASTSVRASGHRGLSFVPARRAWAADRILDGSTHALRRFAYDQAREGFWSSWASRARAFGAHVLPRASNGVRIAGGVAPRTAASGRRKMGGTRLTISRMESRAWYCE